MFKYGSYRRDGMKMYKPTSKKSTTKINRGVKLHYKTVESWIIPPLQKEQFKTICTLKLPTHSRLRRRKPHQKTHM